MVQRLSNEREDKLKENATRRKFVLNESIRKKMELYLKKNSGWKLESSNMKNIKKEKNELIYNLLIHFNHEIIYFTLKEIMKERRKQILKELIIQNAKKKISNFILSHLVLNIFFFFYKFYFKI